MSKKIVGVTVTTPLNPNKGGGGGGEGGQDGFSPIATVTETENGALIEITDKNGKTSATVKNGSDATVTTDNITKALGYTPANQEDVDNLSDEIADLKAQGVQQVPLFANSVEECTDTTKVYVLPDGYIYGYDKKTEEVEKTVTVPAKAAVLVGKRYSLSSSEFKDYTGGSAIVIPINSTDSSITIVIQNMTMSSYKSVYTGVSASAFTVETSVTWNTEYTSFTVNANGIQAINYNGYSYFVICVTSTGVDGQYDNSKVFYNGEEIELVVTTDATIATHKTTTTTTETVEVEGFVNTGRAFVPADYEDRIIELEKAVKNVEVKENLANYINSVHCPSPQLASNIEGTDFNLKTFSDFGEGYHSYFDDLVARYPHYLVKEFLGYDESGTLPIYRYVLGKYYYSAYQKNNYPRMYAWKNGSTTIYSVSCSPRIGDIMYNTAYIGTAYSTVTAVNSTNQSRTVNGLEFVRYEDGDIEPTVSLVAFDSTSVPSGYTRYPFGDLKKDRTKPIHMTIIANEHGGQTEPAIPAVVCARFIRDLCEGRYASNQVMAYLRDNVQLTIIPVVNPHGLNKFASDVWDGYFNANGVNINRNYDTVGWETYGVNNSGSTDLMGDYAGSENETQYVMNTMVDSKAVVAMSVHTISRLVTSANQKCMYQGQNPNGGYTQEKIDEMIYDMKASYNLNFLPYNPLECPPETTSKSPSFITQCGAYGGIVEFQCHNPLATVDELAVTDRTTNTTMFTADVMEQNYSLLLKFIAMWLSDYLDNK